MAVEMQNQAILFNFFTARVTIAFPVSSVGSHYLYKPATNSPFKGEDYLNQFGSDLVRNAVLHPLNPRSNPSERAQRRKASDYFTQNASSTYTATTSSQNKKFHLDSLCPSDLATLLVNMKIISTGLRSSAPFQFDCVRPCRSPQPTSPQEPTSFRIRLSFAICDLQFFDRRSPAVYPNFHELTVINPYQPLFTQNKKMLCNPTDCAHVRTPADTCGHLWTLPDTKKRILFFR